MSTRALNMIETGRLKLPFGGSWYYRQDPVLTAHAEKKGVLLTWDTPARGRVFGIYADYPKTELMQRLLQIPCEMRNCYELIPKTDACTGYIVLRWAGEPDPKHAVLYDVLERLRLRCDQELGVAADPCSYCGTHALAGSPDTQHVYHIIVRNLVFPNNHNGQMRAFFDLGVPQINLNVYTRNRQLLLPHCCPAGLSTPLDRVDKHAGFFSVGSTLWQTRAFVTGPDIPHADQHLFDDVRAKDDPRWAPLDRPEFMPVKPNGAMAARKRGPGRPARSLVELEPPSKRIKPATTQPFPTAAVEELVRGAGLCVPDLTAEPVHAKSLQWAFRAKGGVAACLKCPGEKHAFSVLVRGGDGEFGAVYQCDEGMCWNIPDVVLGTVSYDPELQRWGSQLAPQFPLSAVDATVPLPFPVGLLAPLCPASLTDHEPASFYLTERAEWRICAADAVLLVKYQPAETCFRVALARDSRPLGAVQLTPRGTWGVELARRAV
jgi:hypothetical protein